MVYKIEGKNFIEWKYVPTKEIQPILGVELVKYVSLI